MTAPSTSRAQKCSSPATTSTTAAAIVGVAALVSYGLALPDVLAPGDYRLAAILYDATRADNAHIATAAGADQVTLAQFTVAPRDGAEEEER